MLIFEKVRFQNFLSFGNNVTEVNLSDKKTTVIIGNNGSGKSTFVDAIVFALYGKAFRNINKAQLVNAINEKHMMVELEFRNNRHSYMVRRGVKPNVFEIYQDGNLISQTADARDYQDYLEKHIIKLNYKSFIQIVVIGNANYTPFMQLTAQHRRDIIEDLLDIQVFSTMNVLLKERIIQNREDVNECSHKIDLQEQKVELQLKHLEVLRQSNQFLISQKQKKIKEHESALDLAILEKNGLNIQIEGHYSAIPDRKTVEDNLRTLFLYRRQIETKLNKATTELNFYNDNSICPTCEQNIDHQFKHTAIDNLNAKVKEFEKGLNKLQEKETQLNTRHEAINNILQLIEKKKNKIKQTDIDIDFNRKVISDLEKEIQNLQQRNDDIDNQQDDKLQIKLDQLKSQYSQFLIDRQTYELAGVLLKDSGIKTRIIQQYIPVINKLINKYLAAMDFYCMFELDDNFNEVIKSRYRDQFTYSSFSEGEKFRLDLAMLFCWRAIAKLRNSTSTNLLILDEVGDSSLDNDGVEMVMNIIKNIEPNNNVFIISHRVDQNYDQYDNVVKVVKTKNFSQFTKSE